MLLMKLTENSFIQLLSSIQYPVSSIKYPLQIIHYTLMALPRCALIFIFIDKG